MDLSPTETGAPDGDPDARVLLYVRGEEIALLEHFHSMSPEDREHFKRLGFRLRNKDLVQRQKAVCQQIHADPRPANRVHVAVRMPPETFERFRRVAEAERRTLGDQGLKMIESVLAAYEAANPRSSES